MNRRNFLLASAGAAALAGINMTIQPVFAANTDLGPWLDAWSGDHGGFPRFDKINTAGFKPALLKGIELNRVEIKAIAENASPATFENTLVALEDAGRGVNRAGTLFGVYTSTMNDKEMQGVETEMSPVLAAFNDEVVQNQKLFTRIKTVYDARDTTGLTPEQNRLAVVVYENFVRQGAALDAAKKARVKDINQALSKLYTQFSQNQLADEESDALILDKEEDLAGLTDGMKQAAADDAKGRKMPGKWTIANTRSAMQPFLTYSTRRDLREKGFKMWTNRGDNKNANNNRKVIAQILKLREERANLFSYPSHAHRQLANNMAKTPDAAMNLMMKVWKPAVARVREEVADMQAIVDAEKGGFKIAPWDYRIYAEKVRIAKYDLDQNEVSKYLQLDKIRDGMFWAAEQVYGLVFTKIDGLPFYNSDMSVYEVTRAGKRVGLWYFDPFARAGKNSGAWMNEYRTQERFKGEITPVVSNNCNYVKGKPGEPVLISWDDAKTLFHEFGHALHGLCSNVTYPTLAGTSVKRDFVEFPSQINERWLDTPEVLNKFCLHYQTGKPIPADLVAKIKKSSTFNQGFDTLEYLASALYDMKIHTTPAAGGIDPIEFETKFLAEIGMPSEIVLRHRPTAFGHIFSGDGYSAGYYVYIWADTLSADVTEAFFEKGGMMDKAVAKRFHDTILSIGNSVAPDVAFRNFRGRDVDTNALMRDRGFPIS